jgi:hypothetical protein
MSASAAAEDRPAPLHEADLLALGPRGLLDAARDYVDLGFVLHPRRRGCRLAAEVQGTEDLYACRVGVAPVSGGPPRLEPACPCPSRRPFCKHALALLLLWARRPCDFLDLDGLEGRLRRRPAAELAALCCDAALEHRGLGAALETAAAEPDWAGELPGRCLQEWERFRAAAVERGRWPDEALALGARIGGPPGSPARRKGADAALELRQLAWWLTLAAPDLPPPALRPWLRHLEARLGAARAGSPDAALPPEVGAHLGALAAALPEAMGAERRALAALVAGVPTLAPVFEAQLEVLLWGEELAARLAVAPRRPDAGARCREALEALRPS